MAWICLCSPPRSIFVLGLGLRRRTMRVPGRKRLPGSAGTCIKPLLVQCALFAIKAKRFPEVHRRYLAIKKRRGHKKAIIAIARMLLSAIYNMLKKMSLTILSFIAKLTALPHTVRSSWRRRFSSSCGRIIWCLLRLLLSGWPLDISSISPAFRGLDFVCPFRNGSQITMFQPLASFRFELYTELPLCESAFFYFSSVNTP